MKLKLQGPFKTWRADIARWYVLDGAGLCCLKAISPDATETGAKAICKQAAAALNRDEARKPTKRWEASCRRDGWNFELFCDEQVVSPHAAAKLLNRLGATLPKRRSTKGAKR